MLVAGDDAGARDLLVRILVQAGHRSAGVSPSAVLSLLDTEVPDALVIDELGSAAGSASGIVAAIRRDPRADVARLAVVECAGDRATPLLSWEAGVDAHLLRPFHARDLMAAITSSIERDPADRPAMRREMIVRLRA